MPGRTHQSVPFSRILSIHTVHCVEFNKTKQKNEIESSQYIFEIFEKKFRNRKLPVVQYICVQVESELYNEFCTGRIVLPDYHNTHMSSDFHFSTIHSVKQLATCQLK